MVMIDEPQKVGIVLRLGRHRSGAVEEFCTLTMPWENYLEI